MPLDLSLRRFSLWLPGLLALVLALPPRFASAQDVVILRNDNEFEGQIVEDLEDHLVVLVGEPVGKVSLNYADLVSVNGISADRILGIRAELQDFLARSQRRRGLTPLGAFSKQFMTPQAMSDAMSAYYIQTEKEESARPEQRTLEKLHLIPGFVSLYQSRRDTYGDAQPAYFDPNLRTLILSVAPSVRPGPVERVEKGTTRAQFSSPMERLLLYHELQHVLQQYNFISVLTKSETAPSGDAELAMLALTEGDADLAMLDFLAEDQNVEPDLVADLTGVLPTTPHNNQPRLQSLPPYLADLRVEPQLAGYAFARRVRQAGGWALLGKLFHDPPISTEQILHPEKYLVQYDVPLQIGEGNLIPAMHSPATQIFSDVWGELRTYLLLRRHLGSDEKAREAAAGWAGDRLIAMERDTGQVVICWLTAWDEDKDAQEFFDACIEMDKSRFKERMRALPESTKTLFRGEVTNEDGMWQQQVLAEVRGKEVAVIETSHLPSVDLVRQALWDSPRVKGANLTHQQIQADLAPIKVNETARAFWHGPGLQRSGVGFTVESGWAGVAGGKARFAVQGAWTSRPDGALTCALTGTSAVLKAESFTLPFAGSSALIGLWNEGKPPAPNSPEASRRILKDYPGWVIPAGQIDAYVVAETGTDPELKGVARFHRIYLVKGTEGLLLEIKVLENQMENFGAEIDGILKSLRFGVP